MIGQTLAHYRITAKLGEGGMGEVYRADDTKLRRAVAIKVLPEAMAQDGPRLARFEREARLLASLNHPNIATLYALDEVEGQSFLVMELVEGESLAQKILRSPLPLDEVHTVFRQIAEALDAAHGRGVIHRDLKPSNIQITPEWRVKLLDFGLAKRIVTEPAGNDSLTVALDPGATEVGVLLGTVPYMSPEQARGQAVDTRSDVWSFGCCVFAALCARPPFQGDTALDTLASILTAEPAWSELPSSTPAAIVELLRQCLRKDREARLASIDDILEALDPRQFASIAIPVLTPSVAALPFLALSKDREAEVFAEGMTEDVIAQLVKIEGLKVIARGSVMAFKERKQGLREIAERLGVAAVLDGSVRQAGDRVRIVVQLVEAATERSIWSETYDRDLQDIFAIQSDVALRIASALAGELSSDVQRRVEKQPTDDLRAYRLYLEGRHHILRLNAEGIRQGLELLGKAIRLDPEYVLPHLMTATGYVWIGLGLGGSVLNSREAYGKAEEAAETALRLDPDQGLAHAVLGLVRMLTRYDWEFAEKKMRRGLKLTPGSELVMGSLALLLSAQDRQEEAIEFSRRAQELDPLNPVASSDLASKYLRAERFEEAEREARRLIGLEPDYPLGHATLGWVCLRTGRTEEGLREISRAVECSPESTMLLAQLGQAYGEAGRTEDARVILDRLSTMAAEQYVSPYHLAYVHTGLGDQEGAVECLNRAYEEHASGLYGVKGSFLFAPLHSHPGFRDLLRRMGLA